MTHPPPHVVGPERDWLENYFQGRIGKLLEIGAHTSDNHSLTAGLIARGWEAVLVEPNPHCFLKLLEQHSANPRVQLVHAAIGPTAGLHRFWDDGGGEVSTLSPEHAATFRCNAQTPYREYWLPVLEPFALLEGLGGYKGWTLIVIDAESMTGPILDNLPQHLLVGFGNEVLLVEADLGGVAEIVTHLQSCYTVAECLPPNVIAVAKRL